MTTAVSAESGPPLLFEEPAFRAGQCLVVPAPPVPAVPVPAVVLVVLVVVLLVVLGTSALVPIVVAVTSGHRREHFCNSHCGPFPRWGTASPRRVPSGGYRCAPPERFPAWFKSQVIPRKGGVSELWCCARSGRLRPHRHDFAEEHTLADCGLHSDKPGGLRPVNVGAGAAEGEPADGLGPTANRHVEETCYQVAGQGLGAVLTELHVRAVSGGPDVRRGALAALAEACIVAAGIARPLGNGELSTLAAKRATEAAAPGEAWPCCSWTTRKGTATRKTTTWSLSW